MVLLVSTDEKVGDIVAREDSLTACKGYYGWGLLKEYVEGWEEGLTLPTGVRVVCSTREMCWRGDRWLSDSAARIYNADCGGEI